MIIFRDAIEARAELARPEDAGPARVVLTGDVVTMVPGVDVLKNGRVCIEGNTIVLVAPKGSALPEVFAKAPKVRTDGTIYPGLIDLHNHLTYNHIPLWTVPKKYTNRETWRTQEPLYESGISKPFHVIADNPDKDYRRSIVRFAECRNLLGGVTSGQGMSLSSSTGFPKYFQGLMRNIEQPLDAAFQTCRGQTLNFRPGEVESILVPALKEGRPFVYHLSEGTDADARQMFLNLRLADGSWAVSKALVCIHCVALRPEDFDILTAAAGVVWSPTSNLLLYGATADIAQAKQRGIPIALGADWAPSGCKNLLGELKVARAVSGQLGRILSDKELVEAVTLVPARMIGWDSLVGTVATGMRADLLVLEGTSDDPYKQLIDARESDIRAVLIDGRVRLAQASGFAVGDPSSSEPIAVGGKQFVLDLAEPTNDGLGGMQLSTAIAKLTYGLAHLPELTASFAKQLEAMAMFDEGADRLLPEMEEEGEFRLMDFRPDEAPQVQPMRLEPLTAVDDPDFGSRMKANINLPDYVKAIF